MKFILLAPFFIYLLLSTFFLIIGGSLIVHICIFTGILLFSNGYCLSKNNKWWNILGFISVVIFTIWYSIMGYNNTYFPLFETKLAIILLAFYISVFIIKILLNKTKEKFSLKKKICIIIVIAILLCVTVFSIVKFTVFNPFSSCFGMLEILFTNKEYMVVQNFPVKVAFSKSSNAKKILDEYMENRGFEFVPEEQIGAILVYSNGETKENVVFSVNNYYSKWRWKK